MVTRDRRVAFIRHAQSAGNASGLIDTSTPGPGLTDLGWTQAHRVAKDYAHAGFDGIFASTMVRTQQTAEFLADELDEPVDVLPGLREIEAGDLEGQPEASAADFYTVLKQRTSGDRNARIPGSLDGNEFDAVSTRRSMRSTPPATNDPSRSRTAARSPSGH